MTNQSSRINSLDGLRAFAIINVILAHSFVHLQPVDPILKVLNWVAFNGRAFVSFFFVISGFLITYLLVQEFEQVGKINLKNFYIRRVLRIFPAYYLYLLCFFCLVLLGYFKVTFAEAICAIFFVYNYLPTHQAFGLEHTWSLNVEEQFYLFWPGLLYLLKPKRALYLASSLVLLNPLIRLLSDYIQPIIPAIQNHQVALTLHFNLDYLMMGSVMGLSYGKSQFDLLLEKLFKLKAHFVAAFLVFIVSPILLRLCWNNYLYVQGLIEAPSMALLIIWCVKNPVSKLGLILNSKPAIAIGTISYSLYLWQDLFMPKGIAGIFSYFPLNLIPIFLCASGSYYFVERRFLKMRARFHYPRSSIGT
jgi:peptidoglycan/LPS O-acetylase OafA/YrhL